MADEEFKRCLLSIITGYREHMLMHMDEVGSPDLDSSRPHILQVYFRRC
jgi:hypothetical protein